MRPLESTTSAPHFLFSFQLLAARRKSSSAGSGISNPRRVATVGSRQFLANCGAGCGPRSKIFHGQVSNLNQMTLQRTTDPAGRIPQTDWRPQFDQAHPLSSASSDAAPRCIRSATPTTIETFTLHRPEFPFQTAPKSKADLLLPSTGD